MQLHCLQAYVPGSITMRFGEPMSKVFSKGRCLGTLSKGDVIDYTTQTP